MPCPNKNSEHNVECTSSPQQYELYSLLEHANANKILSKNFSQCEGASLSCGVQAAHDETGHFCLQLVSLHGPPCSSTHPSA